MIIVENLKKNYGKITGTTGVTFTVKGGEILGLVGPDGAGKTTTIKCIAGEKASRGYVSVLGLDAKRAKRKIARQAGFVPQTIKLPKCLRVQKYLEKICKKKLSPTDRIAELSTKFEIPLDRRIKNLSASTKARVAIVVALCTNPQVLVLDEPTTLLSADMQQILFEAIRTESKRGCTILYSTNKLSDVQKVCTKIAIIKKGSIVSIEDGEHFKLKQVKDVSFETEWVTPNLKMVKLDGAKNVKYDGKRVCFEYNGSIKELITYLNTLNITNLEIKDVDMDKLFTRYYE